MVLTTEGETRLGDLAWQIGGVQSIIRVPRHGLYLDGDPSKGYLDLGLRNAEEWGYPIGPDFVFTKAFEWEVRTTPEPVRSIGLPHGLCVELKYLDGDEFAHWTDPASFATSYRNKRKRREWAVFNALQEGTVLPGVHEIARPRRRPHRRPRHPRLAAARPAPPRGRHRSSPPTTSAEPAPSGSQRRVLAHGHHARVWTSLEHVTGRVTLYAVKQSATSHSTVTSTSSGTHTGSAPHPGRVVGGTET